MSETAPHLRPVPLEPPRRHALPLANGPLCFAEVEVLVRGAAPEVLPAAAAETLHPGARAVMARLTAARPAIAGLSFDRPRIMGVVNVTPDSFSDGGCHDTTGAAIAHGLALAEQGADILDIGGESTRPGATTVPETQELDRVLPVIEGLAARGCTVPIAIDTRKAGVAEAALAAGARIVNDVSALTFDPSMAGIAARAEGVCLMHAQGDPETMQDDPRYGDVLLDVYTFLAERLAAAEAAGIARERVILDPGIGFGKTEAHNLALMQRLSLFHALGCPVLLGLSRKRFIGRISGVAEAGRRVAGSLAGALAGVAQGVQILRVHDVAETRQALSVWQAVTGAAEAPREMETLAP